MALPTLDKTPAGANANSYVDLAEANDLLSDISNWDNLSDDLKTSALLQAAILIDKEEFIGEKYSDEQAMQFPRDFQVEGDTPTVEYEVKFEQCRMALKVANEITDADKMTEIDLEEIRVRLESGYNKPHFLYIERYRNKHRTVMNG
jgi:hypothetical protein